MLCGYTAALADHRVPDDGLGFNEALRGYLLVRFGWSASCGWAVAIRDHLAAGEDELSKFFILVDEFKSVTDQVPGNLLSIAERLHAISIDTGSLRRRRRDWVLKQLRTSGSGETT